MNWPAAKKGRGYCGIGIWHGKTANNIGTLWRSADLLGADFIFTIGQRYRPQNSDTMKSWKTIPLWEFADVGAMVEALPRECLLIGVELADKSIALEAFVHPERAIYLLGAEDHGLPPDVLKQCHAVVRLPGRMSMNVASAGTVVLYDRMVKAGR